jgi:ubiquitin-protein ligase
MMPAPYSRRVEQEWLLLQTLASQNHSVLEVLDRKQERAGDLFRVIVRQTCGLVKGASGLNSLETHTAVFQFPEFFPSMPIEASLIEPVFHPNVHPQSGFVCLWNRCSAGDTIMEALTRLQQVITWELMNEDQQHVLQPESIAWYRDPQRAIQLPLPFKRVVKPKEFQIERSYAFRPNGTHRQRLS